MVSLQSALESLVDEWKRHVGPGVTIDHVVGKIDSAFAAQMYKMSSDSPTRSIVSAIDHALTTHGYDDAADDLAEQYGSKKNLREETTLGAFLAEVWPKAPRLTCSNRSARTRESTVFAQKSI